MTKRVQEIETQLYKKEELRLSAQTKLERATELKDDARRMCKVLEERSRLDEERMEKLTSELKDARLLAEDADTKSDDIAKKLQWVEEELEAAEERVKTSEALVLSLALHCFFFVALKLYPTRAILMYTCRYAGKSSSGRTSSLSSKTSSSPLLCRRKRSVIFFNLNLRVYILAYDKISNREYRRTHEWQT